MAGPVLNFRSVGVGQVLASVSVATFGRVLHMNNWTSTEDPTCPPEGALMWWISMIQLGWLVTVFSSVFISELQVSTRH